MKVLVEDGGHANIVNIYKNLPIDMATGLCIYVCIYVLYMRMYMYMYEYMSIFISIVLLSLLRL